MLRVYALAPAGGQGRAGQGRAGQGRAGWVSSMGGHAYCGARVVSAVLVPAQAGTNGRCVMTGLKVGHCGPAEGAHSMQQLDGGNGLGVMGRHRMRSAPTRHDDLWPEQGGGGLQRIVVNEAGGLV